MRPVFPALHPVVLAGIVLIAGAVSSCKPGGSGGGDGNSSIVASIPGIDPSLRTAMTLTFTLACDANQANLATTTKKLTATDNKDPSSTSISFASAGSVNVGDWCFLEVTDSVANDSNLAHYTWTSANKQAGLFFASNAAQLNAQRGLSLTLYTVYIDNNAAHFTSTFLATLPPGASNTNPGANSGSLTCGGVVTASGQATAIGANQVSYTFSLPTAQFTTAQSCDLSATTSTGTYTGRAVATVTNSSANYNNIILNAATGNGSGSGVNINVQSGGACAYNPANQSCSGNAAGTAAAPAPATQAATGTLAVATAPTTANPNAAPAGAQGFWMDPATDPNAPFPSSMYACKGATIINETKMQIALGYYCWLMQNQGSLQAGSFVVDIENIGNITSEANNMITFNNGSVGCEVDVLNQPMVTGYQLITSGGSTNISMSVGDAPEYMGHWVGSPDLSTTNIPIGCIDQTTGAFHQNDNLKAQLLPMMVY